MDFVTPPSLPAHIYAGQQFMGSPHQMCRYVKCYHNIPVNVHTMNVLQPFHSLSLLGVCDHADEMSPHFFNGTSYKEV